MSREHNNANVLCFGARVIGQEMAKMIIDEFLSAKFQGGRHEKRVSKILALEE
jgi:ribose 5-phosphate isomerase B